LEWKSSNPFSPWPFRLWFTFPVESSSADAALKTWQSWHRRYGGRVPTAGAGVAVLDVGTSAVAPEPELAAAHGDER
jgi:hypothetical protein